MQYTSVSYSISRVSQYTLIVENTTNRETLKKYIEYIWSLCQQNHFNVQIQSWKYIS